MHRGEQSYSESDCAVSAETATLTRERLCHKSSMDSDTFDSSSRSQGTFLDGRPAQGSWTTETLAAIAGLLRQDCPDLSTFDVVRLVWRTANVERPEIGRDALLHRARQTAVQTTSAFRVQRL